MIMLYPLLDPVKWPDRYIDTPRMKEMDAPYAAYVVVCLIVD